VIALVVIIVGIQFIRPDHTNPPVDETMTIQANLQVPDEINTLIRRSCYDCHSNETEWPWYSHVAPVSWLVSDDVAGGRRHMNFSEWGTYKKGKVLSILEGMCEETSEGGMPLPIYLIMHSDAALTPDQINALCDWSESEANRLAATPREVE